MITTIMDGKAIAAEAVGLMRTEVGKMKDKPCLIVIIVGDDQASQVYVRNKETKAKRIGFNFPTMFGIEPGTGVMRLPADVSEWDLIFAIENLNKNRNVDSILVQLPLPDHLDEQRILQAVNPKKDVDGFHPTNVGNFFLGNDGPKPCTPSGVIRLLDEYNIETEGKRALVIGRSNIVGKPMAMMLLERNATVTIAHSKTPEIKLASMLKEADIIVSAVGKPKFIKGHMIKTGAVVVDVGINVQNGKLCGDVDTDSCLGIASHITPVPGGVGPMTITMLMEQTIERKKQNG